MRRRRQVRGPGTARLRDAAGWRVDAAVACGRRHSERGEPSQDAAACAAGRRACAVVVCDGAGSALHSRAGARALCDGLAPWLVQRWKHLCGLPEPALRQAILRRAWSLLGRAARARRASPSDVACTLLLVVADARRLLALQVGDGRVALLDAAAAASVPVWRTLLEPTRGEHANETVFVTSRQAMVHLRLVWVDTAGVQACALMTDGAEAALHDRARGRYAAALDTLLEWQRSQPRAACAAALQRSVQGALRERTHDDLTVALVGRLR